MFILLVLVAVFQYGLIQLPYGLTVLRYATRLPSDCMHSLMSSVELVVNTVLDAQIGTLLSYTTMLKSVCIREGTKHSSETTASRSGFPLDQVASDRSADRLLQDWCKRSRKTGLF